MAHLECLHLYLQAEPESKSDSKSGIDLEDGPEGEGIGQRSEKQVVASLSFLGLLWQIGKICLDLEETFLLGHKLPCASGCPLPAAETHSDWEVLGAEGDELASAPKAGHWWRNTFSRSWSQNQMWCRGGTQALRYLWPPQAGRGGQTERVCGIYVRRGNFHCGD